MKKLSRPLKLIQEGMFRNISSPVELSVGKPAAELGSLLNTHRCLIESGVEVQKNLDSHSSTKNIGLFLKS